MLVDLIYKVGGEKAWNKPMATRIVLVKYNGFLCLCRGVYRKTACCKRLSGSVACYQPLLGHLYGHGNDNELARARLGPQYCH